MAKEKTTVTMTANGKSVTVDADQLAEAIDAAPIMTGAVIKGVKICKEVGEIQLVGCNLTGDQYKKLARYVSEKEVVKVAIVPVQKNLFDEDKSSE